MLLRVVRKSSLSDQVFEQLAREIMSGSCEPGTQLPPERTLVETLKVNRHVVREALKRLEQLGLIKIAHGGGTSVLDFKQSAGLDLLALMTEPARPGDQPRSYWNSLHEMRTLLCTDSARLCSLRGTRDIKEAIANVASKMAEVADGPELFSLDLRYWELVVEGTGNIVYRLAFNSLVKGLLAPSVVEQAREWSVQEVKKSAYRVPLTKAILRSDPTAAEIAAREAVQVVLELLPNEPSAPAAARRAITADDASSRAVARRQRRS